jgi:hypothetical protein
MELRISLRKELNSETIDISLTLVNLACHDQEYIYL